ncbi:alpha/beta hydrolase [Persicimonas caeni]|uniref:Alpha/beta hydrolase n=1 Tax=Persicimonas caeni TaxID=2292766 RepID=A0A4Y6PMU1_PERCE|nr:alpha/beta hydrolase [Persicimonas caeni]QDG49611.1 alpha/beta hydrolase [Persicimonas caeni]QED30832.1 alpha/beta hydrolase [Persicimonas caeni]
MPKVQNQDGLDIAYRVIGEGDQDVVFVHGWMVSGAVYNDLIPKLDKSAYRMIVVDLRGTGESSKDADSYKLSDYVEDVRTVADDAGADSFALVGHSMGGQIAQLFAATYPERVERMFLLSTVPASGMELPQEAYDLFYNSGQNRDSQGAILDMACLDLSQGSKSRLLDDAAKIPTACIQQALVSWTEGGFSDQLGDITATTLVVASDDPFLPQEFLQAAVADPIPNAEIAHIPGAGHYIQVERTDETAELLSSFLNG